MASRKNKPITDPDNPKWTAEDFAKDPKDVLSPEVLAQFGKHLSSRMKLAHEVNVQQPRRP